MAQPQSIFLDFRSLFPPQLGHSKSLTEVVKEIVLSDNLLIEESDQLRRMDVGEVMEVFQGAPGLFGEENGSKNTRFRRVPCFQCFQQLGDESFLDGGVRNDINNPSKGSATVGWGFPCFFARDDVFFFGWWLPGFYFFCNKTTLLKSWDEILYPFIYVLQY